MGEHGDQQLPGAAVPTTDAAPPGPRRPRGPWPTVTALVLVLLVGAGTALVLLQREDPVLLGGRYVTDPAAVLADADRALAGYVDGRNGVRAEDSRCWFERTAPEVDDVRDALLCGPVLFVDGDPARTWLRFPVTAAPDGGDVRLSVAALPADAAPDRPADPGLLRRPGGGRPPGDAAGLRVPPPLRAEPGHTAVGPFPGVTYRLPEGPSRLSGPAAAVTVTGLAAPERVGTGDAARRPAEGEQFLAVTYTVEDGEGRSTTPPAVSYQVAGAEPVPVPGWLIAPGTTVEALVSVPAGDSSAALVVVDDGVEQRLSLHTGDPGEENLQVLARVNREVDLDATQQLVGTVSAPGFVPAELPFTVSVARATLQWSAGPDGTARPRDVTRAFLVVEARMSVTGSPPGGMPVEHLRLTLPDGSVVRPVDLDDDPAYSLPAFDVPADLTQAVIGVGGASTSPDGAVVDLGSARASFRLTVPAG
ncbi:hypothetical protein O2W14_03010 [Modestobacter sp. VKM Ac-2986]|uniref:hypothetical protein n=1 Tax=Modestobacter sp. VKM Ac-2986 TaxID=3004140 RepID=UPI0022AA4130|nr:hypothetical protein [Modestobacter sp. VKM Ac-2986]MCZ2827807.1 hypothetical protein [Modestobacter sp. VKM Ac-2986]